MPAGFDTGTGGGSSFDNVLKAIRSVTGPAPAGRGLTGEQAWLDSRGGRPGNYQRSVMDKAITNNHNSTPPSVQRQSSQQRIGTSAGETNNRVYQEDPRRVAATGSGASASTRTAAAPTSTRSTGSAGSTNKDRTGFGKTIPEKALNEAWQDPEALLQAWMQFAGRPTDTPGAAMTQEYADNIGLMWMLINNFGVDDKVGLQDFANWSGSYLENIHKPGQNTANPSQLWNTILNPGEESILHQNMYGPGLSAGEQVDSTLRTARYGLEQYVPALMLDAQLNYMNKLGTDYRASMLTGGKDQGFNEYLAGKGFMK